MRSPSGKAKCGNLGAVSDGKKLTGYLKKHIDICAVSNIADESLRQVHSWATATAGKPHWVGTLEKEWQENMNEQRLVETKQQAKRGAERSHETNAPKVWAAYHLPQRHWDGLEVIHDENKGKWAWEWWTCLVLNEPGEVCTHKLFYSSKHTDWLPSTENNRFGFKIKEYMCIYVCVWFA